MSDLVHYRQQSSLDLAPNAWKLAEKIAATDFVPKALRGKPEAVLACILAGHEAGISPMQALAKIHIVDGRPAMAAELMRALVLQHGHELWYEEMSSTTVTACGKRRDSDRTTKITWTKDDAQRAGLMQKDNWRKYPRNMLTARSTAELCRLIFPDVLAGISYTLEELADTGGADVVLDLGPPEVAELAAPAAAPPATTRTRRVTRDAPATTVDTNERPSGEIPDLPDSEPPPAPPTSPPVPAQEAPPPDDVDDWPSGDWPSDQPPEQGARMTGPQMIAMRIGQRWDLRGNTAEVRAERLDIVSAILDRDVASSKDLTPGEIEHVLTVVANWPEDEPRPTRQIGPDDPPIPPESAADAETPQPPAESPQAPVAPPPRRPPQPAPASPDTWDADAWRSFLTARKVKVSETIREAQRLAATLAEPPRIATLEDLRGSGIEVDLVGWIEDTSLERRSK